jgi:hypothetical protein
MSNLLILFEFILLVSLKLHREISSGYNLFYSVEQEDFLWIFIASVIIV